MFQLSHGNNVVFDDNGFAKDESLESKKTATMKNVYTSYFTHFSMTQSFNIKTNGRVKVRFQDWVFFLCSLEKSVHGISRMYYIIKCRCNERHLVFCEDLGDNSPRYNGIALYSVFVGGEYRWLHQGPVICEAFAWYSWHPHIIDSEFRCMYLGRSVIQLGHGVPFVTGLGFLM